MPLTKQGLGCGLVMYLSAQNSVCKNLQLNSLEWEQELGSSSPAPGSWLSALQQRPAFLTSPIPGIGFLHLCELTQFGDSAIMSPSSKSLKNPTPNALEVLSIRTRMLCAHSVPQLLDWRHTRV